METFLLQTLIFLAAAVVFVPIARRLGLGSVLGYLIGGIIIGPYVFGFVGQEGQDIMHYAEFGVVMMLFLIGLELEPALLWKLRRSILGLGGLQVLLTSILIALICLLFSLRWQEALVLGMILSLSSTAIVLQTLSEKGLMNTAAGQSSFAVLLFQDIAVIPMLAIFPLLAVQSAQVQSTADHGATWVDGQPGWAHGLIVLGAVISIIIVGRLLLSPLLRLIANINQREVFTASALLIVVGIAVLMTQVGLSPALGAFLAGVVLANSEFKHELESDIEPFKGLLLGLFFIAVGASINFQLVASQLGLVLGCVLSLITIKTGILLLLGKLFKISSKQNAVFAFGLSQVGEFAFVLLSLAQQQGILPVPTGSLMMAVVAISMASTPLVNLLTEKLLLPRLALPDVERPADTIHERNQVIIAGFGDFGSTIGRFLRANSVGATYLDMDSDRVDALRKMGFNVFYGDSSRQDLLQAAGAQDAKLIIIALNDAEKRLRMIDTVKKHFPHLHILVRASNRYDAYDQMNAGMLHVYRETLDTSLRMGIDALSLLGIRKYRANRLAHTFRKHDELTLKKLAAIRNEEEYIIEARKFIEEIELIIQSDKQDPTLEQDAGWNPESLREEAKEA